MTLNLAILRKIKTIAYTCTQYKMCTELLWLPSKPNVYFLELQIRVQKIQSEVHY